VDLNSTVPLKIHGLKKSYGSFTAVNDVSFEVRPGEIFGLLGPNGAGKTSIISCIVTLQEPTSGNCQVFGFDPQMDPLSSKMLTGYVPQEIINHGYFDVEEILTFHSGYFGVWNNRERIHYLLHRLGLFEHRHKKVKALSGGMKRRLLIAKALVHKPKLLLLDEPTAGVDIELRASLWNFVRELQRDGISVLLTTHYLEEAEELCDRVGVLRSGRLIEVGPTRELIEKMTKRKVTLEFKNPCDPQLSSPYLVQKKMSTAEFLIPQELGIGELLLSISCNISELMDIRISEGSLEDAFVRILDGSDKDPGVHP
jgi:ABC-2 type transport system ATP-binding protein